MKVCNLASKLAMRAGTYRSLLHARPEHISVEYSYYLH